MKQGKLPAHAERLWLNLQSNFLDATKIIIEIIETEAWKPAYESFTDAWADKMSNISLASELLPHVVYQMFGEGATVEEVADKVKGVGPEKAKSLKRQRQSGVPASEASTVVREHSRRRPTRYWISFEIDLDTNREYHNKAKRHGTTVSDVAMRATAEAFEKMR